MSSLIGIEITKALSKKQNKLKQTTNLLATGVKSQWTSQDKALIIKMLNAGKTRQEFAAAFPKKDNIRLTAQITRLRSQLNLKPLNQRWSQSDNQRLKHLRSHGMSWLKIANQFTGRTPLACEQHWRTI